MLSILFGIDQFVHFNVYLQQHFPRLGVVFLLLLDLLGWLDFGRFRRLVGLIGLLFEPRDEALLHLLVDEADHLESFLFAHCLDPRPVLTLDLLHVFFFQDGLVFDQIHQSFLLLFLLNLHIDFGLRFFLCRDWSCLVVFLLVHKVDDLGKADILPLLFERCHSLFEQRWLLRLVH